ncbi:MAG TPA: hypothetical protein VNT55_00165, partial [Baekduia sp.]|nr:hypothetical protein [Baekduia sp.]
ADVQQEREDLAGPGRRPADDWLGEDIDFVPRRRMTRARTSAAPIEGRFAASASDDDRVAPRGAADPLHGVFVPATPHAAVATSRTIELSTDEGPVPAEMAHELAHLSAADDPFATPPPPAGTRRTVQIKGRPTESRLSAIAAGSRAQRHRGRTTSDRVGPRPDRIALWAVALGAILILLAAMTSSSQAAVRHARTSAPAATTAKIAHATPHTPLRAIHRHR